MSNFGAFHWAGKDDQGNSRKKESEQQEGRQRSRSPVKHPRKTLESAFDNLTILSSSKSVSMPHAFTNNLRATGWPNWKTTIRGSSLAQSVNFTIKMKNGYRIYLTGESATLPQQIYSQFQDDLHAVREFMQENKDLESVIRRDLMENLCELVFSSNAQERVGLNLDETIKICRQIFQGHDVRAENITPRTEEYQKALEALIQLKRLGTEGLTDEQHVVRSRLEIINHVKALQFITKAIAVDNLPLTENIVLETHKILTIGLDITPNGPRWQNYAGKYRTVPVHAGSSNFVVPQKIPKAMKELFDEFNVEISKIDTTLEIDPVWIATKYCENFVDIHPFLDGNGRVCRLILNSLLLKYAGTVVSIGGHDAERKEYLDVRIRAGEQMEGPGEMSFLVLKRVQKNMSTFRLRCQEAIKGKAKGKA